MTTDPFELVRKFLERSYGQEGLGEALATLDSIRDTYLPLEMLPDGWKLYNVGEYHHMKEYYCNLTQDEYLLNVVSGRGTTPNAAFLAAVKAIGGEV